MVGELEGLLQCLQGGSLSQHQGCSPCGWGVEVKQELEVHIHRTQEQVIIKVCLFTSSSVSQILTISSSDRVGVTRFEAGRAGGQEAARGGAGSEEQGGPGLSNRPDQSV